MVHEHAAHLYMFLSKRTGVVLKAPDVSVMVMYIVGFALNMPCTDTGSHSSTSRWLKTWSRGNVLCGNRPDAVGVHSGY